VTAAAASPPALRTVWIRILTAVRWTILAVVAAVVLIALAYCNGVWPHRLVCVIDGPEGTRLVAVADRACDIPLPVAAAACVRIRSMAAT
jgi:hypothetical protein